MLDPKPTDQSYFELQQAFDYFNAQVFAGELPQCLITLQRQWPNLRLLLSQAVWHQR
jgi:hypothetical protein